MRKKRKKKTKLTAGQKALVILLMAAAFIAGALCTLHFTGILTFGDILVKLGRKDKPAVDPGTHVHFIDVGQGDATLVISEGEVMLIDAGDTDKGDEVTAYLKDQGVSRIDYLIITHPHADHMGGAPEVIDSFEIGKLIMPEVPEEYQPTTVSYEKLLDAVERNGLKITLARDSEFMLGECEVSVYASRIVSEELNDYSVVVRLEHGKNSFLFMGDCEEAGEKELIKRGVTLRSKVLKVGHHGSSSSSSADFLNKVKPRYAVISCGKDNDYGHPSEKIVTRLGKYADKTYITSRCGTVVFSSDGEGLSVKTERGG